MFDSIVVGGKGGVVVFAQFQDPKTQRGAGLDARSKSIAAALGAWDAIRQSQQRPESTGESGGIVECFPGGKSAPERVIVVGLGTLEKFEVSSLRGVIASVGRRLAALKVSGAALEIEGAIRQAKGDVHDAGVAVGEGLGLLSWTCDEFRGKGSPEAKRSKLKVRGGGAEFERGLARGLALAESANLCRTLSQTPPNVATPMWMAEQAQKLARKTGLSCRVFKGEELVREKFEGLINVGKASENKPCMIRLEYRPKGGGRGKPAVLIGKTMTYDTGGLSLKVNNGMVGMKRDKDGGCAVLGAMHAIATTIKPKRRVVALLASAENSVSDEAYRPDDVLRFRNGVTVEVTNTDAEGRLVLADALCYACEKEDPAYIVDLATLTGGVVVALGSTYAGMFCEDDKLRARIEAASRACGERVWRLPMHSEYRELMKSPVADIVNSNPNRKAHPIQGAAFLDHFVEPGTPWCHLDIAGVHAADAPTGAFIAGPTGWGTRLLANLLDAD
jgi:leucyl aminopeptidase